MAFKKKVKQMRRKVINATANVLSAPSRARSKYRGKKADAYRSVLKKARAGKGAPQFANGKPTDAFKYQTTANAIRTKLKRKARKKQ